MPTDTLLVLQKYRNGEKEGSYRSDFIFDPVYLNRNEEIIYLKMLIDVLNIMLQRCYSFLSTKISSHFSST